jgi:hypothetical protein
MLRHFALAVHGEPPALRRVIAALREDAMLHKTQRRHSFEHGYVSDFERFIGEFAAQHPELEENRMRGWYTYWDQRVDLDELDKQHADAVPVKPYHYE